MGGTSGGDDELDVPGAGDADDMKEEADEPQSEEAPQDQEPPRPP